MKNTKEIDVILVALFCLNKTGNEDEDITSILDYAFHRILDANTNLFILSCIGQTREEMKKQVMQLLEQTTQYKEYLEKHKK